MALNANSSAKATRSGFPSGDFTVAMWAKVESWGGAQFQTFMQVVVGGVPGDAEASIGIDANTDKVVRFFWNGTTDVLADAIADTAYTGGLYVAISRSGTTLKIRVLKSGETTFAQATQTGWAGAPGTVWFFSNTYNEQAENIVGLQPRIFTDELSDAELLAELASETPVKVGSVYSAYSFAIPTGWGEDTSSNNRDLTVTGTPLGSSWIPEEQIPIKLHFLGNSLVQGFPGSSYSLAAVNGLASRLNDNSIVNSYAGAYTSAQLISAYSTQTLPQYDSSKRNILLFWEGVNSMWSGGGNLTAIQERDQLEPFFTTAKTDGFEVVTVTMLPVNDLLDTRLEEYNVLIRTSTSYNLLIDLRAGLPQFSPPGTPGNPLYSDDTHLSVGLGGGYDVSTQYIADILNSYLGQNMSSALKALFSGVASTPTYTFSSVDDLRNFNPSVLNATALLQLETISSITNHVEQTERAIMRLTAGTPAENIPLGIISSVVSGRHWAFDRWEFS